MFFRLKQGEFIAFADGKDKKVHFKRATIQYERPRPKTAFSEFDLKINLERTYREVKEIKS